MPKRKTGVNPLAYTGVRALTPPNIIFEDRAPKPTDYIGHVLGDWWVYARDRNTTPIESPRREDIWILVSKDQRLAKQLYPNVNKPKAVWINLGDSDLETITGDIGGAVGPDNNDNINLLGGDDIQVTGDPNTNTLTIDSTSTDDIETLTGDTGGAIPSDNNNNINILGGNDIQVNGAGNTLTIESTSLDIETLTGDTGGARPPQANGNFNIVGGSGGMSVAGAGSTLTVNSTTGTSAFEARMTTDKNNVTGTGTTYKLQWDVTDSNIGNDFSLANNQYVVPADGLYQFNCAVSMRNISSGMNAMAMAIRFDAETRVLNKANPYASLSSDGILRRNGSISRYLTAGTTVSIELNISGGAGNTAQVWSGESTGTTRDKTWFTGFRVF